MFTDISSLSSFLSHLVVKNIQLSLFVLAILLYTVIFYWKVYTKYPKGPLPLPIIGNLWLILKGQFTGKLFFEILSKPSKHFGQVYTVWIGRKPFVVVSDAQLVVQLLKNKNCAGRPSSFYNGRPHLYPSDDVGFMLFSHQITLGAEAIKKYSVMAMKLFSGSEAHKNFVVRHVDTTLDNLKEKPFVPMHAISPMLLAIMWDIAASFNFTFDDPVFKKYHEELMFIEHNLYIPFMSSVILGHKIIMILTKIFGKFVPLYRNGRMAFRQHANIGMEKYRQHEATIDEGNLRDMMDALISLKRDAENKGLEDAKYLTPANIVYNVMEIVFGAVTNVSAVISWWLVMCANHPDMQDRMRREVEEAFPENDDFQNIQQSRDTLPFTQAFIHEVMRFRPTASLGVPHQTLNDVTIRSKDQKQYNIPQGTGLFLMPLLAMKDADVWKDPQVFRPERFLESNDEISNNNECPLGDISQSSSSFFIPFSAGKRICLGKVLGQSTIFLIVVRMLQQTRGHRFVLDGVEAEQADLSGDRRILSTEKHIFFQPNPEQKIRLVRSQ